jgi:transcriptional regulator with XRE-family HTH domain
MATTGTVDIGSVIRGARAAARLTQAQVGAGCGYSASAISRIESGAMQPGREALALIATLLEIQPSRLGVATVAGQAHHPQEDAVHRRNLLAGAAGIGIALAAGVPAAAAARLATTDPAAGLEAALFTPAPAQPIAAARLDKGLAAAKADFMAARYDALGEHLPALLGAAEATRDAATGQAREVAHAVVARGYVLATELALKQHADLAWATADRALTAARACGDPAVLGEATRVLAITMRRAGRASAAVDLLRRTAGQLAAEHGPEPRAVAATLLMTGAYTAACTGRRGDALDLMGGAEQAVRQLPASLARPLFTVDATTAQADLYWVGVHNALGTPDEAVPYARRLTGAVWPTAERRARAGTDTARMWHQLGDQQRTFAALRQVEAAAPEEVRRPALRALTTGLLYGPSTVPGLREFAQRTGAV